METLSSCYFCGAALDEPLEEYPVVPSEFREGEPSTLATLCPGCHRKLETIFDEVLSEAGPGVRTDTEPTSLSPGSGEPSAEEHLDEPSAESSANADFEESTMGLADADDVLTDPEQPSTGEEEAIGTPDGPDLEETPGEIEEPSSGQERQETTADSPDADTGNEVTESEGDEDAGDDEKGDSRAEEDEAGDSRMEEDESTDDDEVTVEDVEAMAGDLDPDIVEDDEPESGEDDELEDAMEPDVPAAFQAGDDTDAEAESEDSASSEAESADEGDMEEQVSAGVEGGEDEQSDVGEETVEDAMEPDVPAEFQSEGGDDSIVASEPTEPSEAESGDEAKEESEGTGEAKEESEGTGEAEEETATEGQASVSRSVSALEYNKVMRLLQNREFPVDRDEIETVAASAYELAESECAEVIDLAVDRGLLDEEDGKLIRP